MAEGKFYQLGRDPKKMNDMAKEDKMNYPCLYLDAKQFPALKGMKIGDTGLHEAVIKFKLAGSNLDIVAIKYVGPTSGKAKESNSSAGVESPMESSSD